MSKIEKPDDPVKKDYEFKDWFVGEEKWSFIGHVVTEDTAELPVPTRQGHTFLGWYNGDTKAESFTISEGIETFDLVAKWESNE